MFQLFPLGCLLSTKAKEVGVCELQTRTPTFCLDILLHLAVYKGVGYVRYSAIS